jgi:hypothetical protein
MSRFFTVWLAFDLEHGRFRDIFCGFPRLGKRRRRIPGGEFHNDGVLGITGIQVKYVVFGAF